MKKIILSGTVILALAAANLQTARANESDWATVGKVLTGVAVVGLIVAAADGHVQGSVNLFLQRARLLPAARRAVQLLSRAASCLLSASRRGATAGRWSIIRRPWMGAAWARVWGFPGSSPAGRSGSLISVLAFAGFL